MVKSPFLVLMAQHLSSPPRLRNSSTIHQGVGPVGVADPVAIAWAIFHGTYGID